MSYLKFAQSQVAAALARGVRQYVLVSSRSCLRAVIATAQHSELQVFTVGEYPEPEPPATFIETQFGYETLATALDRSEFDRKNPSLFVWLGGAGYRTLETVLASLAFIASLPRESGLLFNYVVERSSSLKSRTQSALDALASRISVSGDIKHVIEPQAVASMLRSVGFKRLTDHTSEELGSSGEHLVSAFV